MNAMLTKYLKDFSVPAPVGTVGNEILSGLQDPAPSMDFDFEPEPQIDIEAERREAHEEGYREAAAELESRYEAEILALRQQHAAEIRALAEAHDNEVVSMIHTRFHEMTYAISQAVTENTLQVLLPVFDEMVCHRSIAALGAMTREALIDPSTSVVVVRGPERLYQALKPLLDRDGVESRFIETDELDLAVEINDLVLVTRLSAWSQALAEVNE
jgi:hypothetical protein